MRQSIYILIIQGLAGIALAVPTASSSSTSTSISTTSSVTSTKSCNPTLSTTINFDKAPTGTPYAAPSGNPFTFNNFVVDNINNDYNTPIIGLKTKSAPNFAFLQPEGGSSIVLKSLTDYAEISSFWFACTTLVPDDDYPAPCNLTVQSVSQFNGVISSASFYYPSCDLSRGKSCSMTQAVMDLTGGEYNFFLTSSARYPSLLVDNVVLTRPNPKCDD